MIGYRGDGEKTLQKQKDKKWSDDEEEKGKKGGLQGWDG